MPGKLAAVVILLTILPGAPLSWGASEEGTAATIRGTVSDPAGKPLSGATVRAKRKSEGVRPMRRRPTTDPPPTVARTGEDGSFRIDGLESGSYDLRVEAAGFAPSLHEAIPRGASVRVRMKPGVPLGGQVFDLEARRPVPGAAVRAWDPGARAFGKDAAVEVRADDDGRFRFENLPAGSVRLEAWAAGKAVERVDDVVVEPPKADEPPRAGPSIFLRPGARLAGRVVDGAGKPVDGAAVSLDLAGGFLAAFRRGGTPVERTDSQGRFAFEGVLAGTRAAVTARMEGYSSASTDTWTVDAGRDRLDLELKLGATAALTFVLKDPNDHPLTDVELTLDDPDGRGGRRGRMAAGGRLVPEERIEPGEGGVVRVGNLDPGTFDVRVLPWGFEEIERTGVRLKAGETTDLGPLRAREGTSVSGTVLDSAGSPVKDAQVFALWMDGDRPRTRTVKVRADGTWKLAGLAEAPIRQLRAFARGYSAEERAGAMPGDRNVDFVLLPAGVVLGRVLLPDGNAPPAFRVKVHEEAGSRRETGFMARVFMGDGDEETFTDPTGNFRLDTVEPGTVTLEAVAEGWAPARKPGVRVESGREIEAGTLVLDPGRTLRGLVLDVKDDAPLPGAVVTMLSAQGPMRFRFGSTGEPTAISDMGGVFTLAGLESRAYTAAVEHPDFAPYQTQVDIPAEEDPPELVVRLGRGGILTGTVRDAARQPVEGAVIIALRGMMEGTPQDATSGPDGVYRFERLSPGTYQVVRTPRNDRVVMGLGMKQAVVREGETTVLDFDEKSAITLRGTVLRGGNPVAGATLIFAQGTGAFPRGDVKTATAGADGRYEIGLDAAGTYTVIVQSDLLGSRGASVQVFVPEGQEPVVDVVLRVGAISGRVVNEEGEPVVGAVVTAHRRDASTPAGFGSGVGTRPDGTFAIESLEDGVYQVTATAAGYRSGEAGPVEIRDGAGESNLEIRLESGGEIRGRVVDPRGGPVEGASVAAFPSGSAQQTFLPTSTDVNGTFVMTSPSDGPIDLIAVARGYAPARATGVTPDENPDGPGIVLRVTSGGSVKIRVMDGAGAPLAGARVTLAASPPYPGSQLAMFMNGNLVTGPDGTAIGAALAPGTYSVLVESGGTRTEGTVAVAEGQQAQLSVSVGAPPGG